MNPAVIRLSHSHGCCPRLAQPILRPGVIRTLKMSMFFYKTKMYHSVYEKDTLDILHKMISYRLTEILVILLRGFETFRRTILHYIMARNRQQVVRRAVHCHLAGWKRLVLINWMTSFTTSPLRVNVEGLFYPLLRVHIFTYPCFK